MPLLVLSCTKQTHASHSRCASKRHAWTVLALWFLFEAQVQETHVLTTAYTFSNNRYTSQERVIPGKQVLFDFIDQICDKSYINLNSVSVNLTISYFLTGDDYNLHDITCFFPVFIYSSVCCFACIRCAGLCD